MPFSLTTSPFNVIKMSFATNEENSFHYEKSVIGLENLVLCNVGFL